MGRGHRRPPEGHVQLHAAPRRSRCASRRAAGSSACRRSRRSARRASRTTRPPRPGIIGLTWSTANALAKYGVTANAIMPSGATRMIDSTPRGAKVFEETGKWPSEQAVGHRARPRQRRAAGRLPGERRRGERQRPGLPLLRVRLHAARAAARRPPPRGGSRGSIRRSWRSCSPRRLAPTSSCRPAPISGESSPSGRRPSGRISARACVSGSGRGRNGEPTRAVKTVLIR